MKKAIALLLAALMLLSLGACGGEAPSTTPGTEAADTQPAQTDAPTEAGGTRTVTDGLGRVVEIPQTVERLGSLGNASRQLAYMGLADKIVGISASYNKGGFTPVTAFGYVNSELWYDLPAIGSGDGEFYAEEILMVKPDVIFCTFPQEIADDMQAKTGVPVLCFATNNLFGEDYKAAYTLIGEVCGKQARAAELNQFIDDCLADLDARTANIPDDRPTVLAAAASFKGAHGIEGVRLKDSVLDAINTPTVAKSDDVKASAAEVSREQILVWDPDYIFCDASNVHLVTEDQASDPAFYAQLRAYNNGHIYQTPNGTSMYSNVEIPLANAYYIGSILYPDAFADVDYEAKANEIIEFFLGAQNYLEDLAQAGFSYGPVEFGK